LKAHTFVAPSSREALRRVREALGTEAIVLSNRALPDGVEIVAMAGGAIGQALDGAAPPAQQHDAVLSELHAMRGMLEEQLADALCRDQQRQHPVRGRLLRTLLGAGFSAGLSRAVLDALPERSPTYADGMAFVRAELARAMPVMADEEALLAQGGVYALTGPTGVGKTTTTAKLAARCVMRFGAGKLALVTTDGFRIGAHEQLRIYGRILDVPVYAVKDPADLQVVLQELGDKHLVLIDTVGMSQRDRAVPDQIAMLGAAPRAVRRLLLLNAGSHGDTLNEVVHAYRQGAGSELAGCIFTKVDEATHAGALIDTVIRHRLPVHYVSGGQKVPENLALPDRAQLVDAVFQPRRHHPLFVPPDTPMREEAVDAGQQATSHDRQLRSRYDRLIRAMAHDAQALADAAATLSGAGIGFDTARRLWRQLGEGDARLPTPAELLDALASHADEAAQRACGRHVLATYGGVTLPSRDGGDAYVCHGGLLLSDRDGAPFSAPDLRLSTGAVRGAARQAQSLHARALPKPVVHLLAQLSPAGALQAWQAQGVRWLARAPGTTGVIEAEGGASSALARVPFAWGPACAATWRGKPARRRVAQARVLLRAGAEAAPWPALRAVAVQLLDARTGQLLAQHHLLSNAGDEVAADQLAQWHGWSLDAQACLRLLRRGVALAGGLGEPGDATLLTRLRIAGQVATTVWGLQRLRGEAADRTHALVAQLAGRAAVGGGRRLSGPALYLGLDRLLRLLDALDSEAAVPEAAAPAAVSMNMREPQP